MIKKKKKEKKRAHPFVWTEVCLPKFLYLTPFKGTQF